MRNWTTPRVSTSIATLGITRCLRPIRLAITSATDQKINVLQFRQGLNLAKAAVSSLGADSKEGKAIQKVIDFYGAAGKDNGVNVSLATMKQNETGSAVMGKDGAIHITFDLQQINASGAHTSQFGERAATAIHEGRHGIDERRWGHNPLTGGQEDWTEHNAYATESFTGEGLGWPLASGVWRPGMTETERSAAIDAAAERSDAAACGGNQCN
jgi:hypothetical protein